MAGSTDRRERISERRGATAAVLIVSAVIVAGVVATGGPGVPSPSPSAAPGATPKAAPSVALASPGATVPPDSAWSPLQVAAFVPLADLRADRADFAGLQLDTTFTLTSRSGADPRTLATRLQADPSIGMAVVDATTGASVGLRPSTSLTAGRVYRFSLRAEDGTLAGSWAFQARAPLRVVSLLPGDATNAVPVDTGIEITFDQDGAADMAPYFSISPAVSGRFERHGRAQVFVPVGLAASTLYTVTVRHGLPVSGTELTLERDVTFRFETAGPAQPAAVRFTFGRDVLEASPAEAPVVGLYVENPGSTKETSVTPPTSVGIRVYRFPSREATLASMRQLLAMAGWTAFATPSIPTAGLSAVMTFSASLGATPGYGDRVITFPARLPVGWYLLEAGTDRPAQAILQVTDVSAWVSVLTDQTVAWVNAIGAGGPIPGAAVSVAGGRSLGRTGPDGILVASTPAELLQPEGDLSTADVAPAVGPSPILVVEAPNGHAVLVPFDVSQQGQVYPYEWGPGGPSDPSGWWSVLGTDRSVYRRDDRIAAWGFLRDRLDGRVPASVELRLILPANTGQADPPAVVWATATPTASGAYAAEIPLVGVALGTYYLQAVVEGRVASTAWVTVGIIHKPAYQLTLTTDRHVVVAGDRVTVNLAASFFDGQPVPGTSIAVRAEGGDPSAVLDTLVTDAAGRATTAWTVPPPPGSTENADRIELSAAPSRPEEGEIVAYENVQVFPSAVTISATGALTGSRLVVKGSAHEVDLARLERELAKDPTQGIWNLDPNGKPVVGARVTAQVAELVPVRTLAGSDYDPITKLVVPRYEYTTQRKPLRTLTLTTGAGGAFGLTLAVPDATHEYEVVLRAPDAAGRNAQRTIVASRPAVAEPSWQPDFTNTGSAGGESLVYRIGQPVSLTMTNADRPLPSGPTDRYLYIVAQQGLRSAWVATAPRLDRTFGAADAPGVDAIGVHFTGRTYEPRATAHLGFDTRQRSLTVKLSGDRAGYRPGETAAVTVRTTDEAGRPVPATVTLRVVDEKLFAMGAAQIADPLADLYIRVPSGVVRFGSTHQLPVGGDGGGRGNTTGGGGAEARDDFRDTLFFRQLQTDAGGGATVRFRLSDDLTAWHVSASAMTASLSAGEGQLLLPVGLPFFVDATIADVYLASDRPVIRLRAYGSALHAGDAVSFSVAAPSLGLVPTRVAGTAFRDVSLPLPPLSVGRHEIAIDASAAAAGGAVLADRLVRTVSVVRSRTTRTQTAFATLGANLVVPGGSDVTTFTFTDAGRGRLIAPLTELATSGGSRIDQAAAAAIARDLLLADFGFDPAMLPPDTFDPATYPVTADNGTAGEVIATGLPLLPYGGPDARLTARVALVAADRFDQSALRDALIATRDLASTTPDLRIAALAGLAALGEPVLADLRSAAASAGLGIGERIDLALGFVAAGDDQAALAIERDLLATYGQQLGAWTRLRVGTTRDETIGASAGLALVAAGIGDPIASSLQAFVDDNPASDDLHVLERMGVIERMLARTPATAASFAWTVDGRRAVVDLAPGQAFTVALTAAQRATLRLESLSGQVGLAVSWSEPVDLTTLTPDPALGLARTITPAGTIGPDSLVVVEVTPTFGAQAILGAYQVTDVVPSGLSPVARTDGWVGDDGTIGPYRIVGQEVDFWAWNGPPATRVGRMRYLARIVTPGDYAWEPASMRLAAAPQDAAFTIPTRVTIADR